MRGEIVTSRRLVEVSVCHCHLPVTLCSGWKWELDGARFHFP
jgi:hypothetical protein